MPGEANLHQGRTGAENRGRFSVLYDVIERVLSQRIVNRYDNQRVRIARLLGQHPLDTIHRSNAQAVALTCTDVRVGTRSGHNEDTTLTQARGGDRTGFMPRDSRPAPKAVMRASASRYVSQRKRSAPGSPRQRDSGK